MGAIYLNNKLYGADTQVVDISQAAYDQLTQEQKMSGIIYCIYDGVPSAEAASIIPNPEGAATERLTSIKIGNTIYSVSGGGGGNREYTGSFSFLNSINPNASIEDMNITFEEVV